MTKEGRKIRRYNGKTNKWGEEEEEEGMMGRRKLTKRTKPKILICILFTVFFSAINPIKSCCFIIIKKENIVGTFYSTHSY